MLFDLCRRERRHDRIDLHLRIGDVGNGINWQFEEIERSPTRDKNGQDYDRQTEADSVIEDTPDKTVLRISGHVQPPIFQARPLARRRFAKR